MYVFLYICMYMGAGAGGNEFTLSVHFSWPTNMRESVVCRRRVLFRSEVRNWVASSLAMADSQCEASGHSDINGLVFVVLWVGAATWMYLDGMKMMHVPFSDAKTD